MTREQLQRIASRAIASDILASVQVNGGEPWADIAYRWLKWVDEYENTYGMAVARASADVFQCSVSGLFGPTKHQPATIARQIAMGICQLDGGWGCQPTALFFKRKDHATALHAKQLVLNLPANSQERKKLNEIRARLEKP